MNVLAIIPARGGSKGIPNKNLTLVAGKPLLAHTAYAALAAKSLSRVLLSTDDETIAEAGKQLGLEVPFLRPAALASDDTPMLDVMRHALEAISGDSPEAVVLLQPTSPLRTAKDIDDAVALFVSTGADTVVSVVEVPHRYAPASLMRMDGDRLYPLVEGKPVLSRQEKKPVFARNGPALLIVRTSFLKTASSFYAGDTRAFVMPHERSVDIDDPFDITVASFLLSQRSAKG